MKTQIRIRDAVGKTITDVVALGSDKLVFFVGEEYICLSATCTPFLETSIQQHVLTTKDAPDYALVAMGIGNESEIKLLRAIEAKSKL